MDMSSRENNLNLKHEKKRTLHFPCMPAPLGGMLVLSAIGNDANLESPGTKIEILQIWNPMQPSS
jgi:hypothetical protein